MSAELERTRAEEQDRVSGIARKCTAFCLMEASVLPVVGESRVMAYSRMDGGRFLVFSQASSPDQEVNVSVHGPSPLSDKEHGPHCAVSFGYVGMQDYRDQVVKAYGRAGFQPCFLEPSRQ